MEKEKIDRYRETVAQEMVSLAQQNHDALTLAEALEISRALTDEQLADGMDWNTPEDVAHLLLESGL